MTRQNRPDVEEDDDQRIDAQHHHDPADDAEQVRSVSQTAQDLSHTIRGGDDRTAPMKEFPS